MADSSNKKLSPDQLANGIIEMFKDPKLLARVFSALDPVYKNMFGYFISKHRFGNSDDDDYSYHYREYKKLPDKLDQDSIEKLSNIFADDVYGKYGEISKTKHQKWFKSINDPEIVAIQQYWEKLESLVYEVGTDGKPDHKRLKKLEDLDIETRSKIEYYYKNLQKGITHKNQLLQRADYELHNHHFGLLDVLSGTAFDVGIDKDVTHNIPFKIFNKSWVTGLFDEFKYSWNTAQKLKRPNRSIIKRPGDDIKFKSYEDYVSESGQDFIKDLNTKDKDSKVQSAEKQNDVDSKDKDSKVQSAEKQNDVDSSTNAVTVCNVDDIISEIKIVNSHLDLISKNTKKLEEISKGVDVVVKKINGNTFINQLKAFVGEGESGDAGVSSNNNASDSTLMFMGGPQRRTKRPSSPKSKPGKGGKIPKAFKNPITGRFTKPIAAAAMGLYALNAFGNDNQQSADSDNNLSVGGFLGSAIAPTIGQVLGRAFIGRLGGAIGAIGGPVGFAVGSIAGDLIANNWDKITATTSEVLEAAATALSSDANAGELEQRHPIYAKPEDTNSELSEDATQQVKFKLDQQEAVKKSAETMAESVSRIENQTSTSNNQTSNNVNIGGNTTVVNQSIRNGDEHRRVNGTDRYTFVSPNGCVFTGTD